MAKTALITGITGQDGSYLSELLLSKGYDVHGLIRRNSAHNFGNIAHLTDKITIHYGDMEAGHDLALLIADLKPDEIYNLAAQSDVGISFQCPETTFQTNTLAVLSILQAVRLFSPKTKIYQAGTSEMFGNEPGPQNEKTRMAPVSPYGAAKLAAFNLCQQYRKSCNLFICNGILFNHESQRRGPHFVTRKITVGIANILKGFQTKLELGNLGACRDWGHAQDYVYAMWLMMQQDKPDDFVIGTGETHSVKEFVKLAFEAAGLDWQKYITVNPAFYRPLDINFLIADASKAQRVLGWKPEICFPDLVKRMLDNDLKRIDI